MSEKTTRKKNRLDGYDYSQEGAYFVTVCSKNRTELFGEVVTKESSGFGENGVVGATVPGRPRVKLSNIGEIIENAILYYNNNTNHIEIGKYVIMPNHIHAIILLRESGDRGRSPLQWVVRNLKSYVTKQIGFSPWQRSYHDHIIRSYSEYMKITEYIKNNPAQWTEDMYYIEQQTM